MTSGQAILCAIERFSLGVAAITLFAGGILLAAWLIVSCGRLARRMSRHAGLPVLFSQEMLDRIAMVSGIVSVCIIAGIVIWAAYSMGADVAHRLGLCRVVGK